MKYKLLLFISDAGLFLLDFLTVAFLTSIIVLSIVFKIRKRKYTKFVLKHSKAIKELIDLNNQYDFKDVKNLDMEHSYDNEIFYDSISCRDYLTYQLVYIGKKVVTQGYNSIKNKSLFEKYRQNLSVITLGRFDVDEKPSNEKYLSKTEKRVFEKTKLKPITEFSINVTLRLTNIRGYFKDRKTQNFSIFEIEEILQRLNQKINGFYQDRKIWNSICRVERGKVTNRMRFSIYKRDGYRCCKCGRRTNDLEVDHIIPIAKGGKSSYDNLQTLCHRCNAKKGADIEY